MKVNWVYLLLTLVLFSCNTKPAVDNGFVTKESVREKITQIDDSLQFYFDEMMDNKRSDLPYSTIDKAIALHQTYYSKFPNDDYAAESLDKIHQLHLQKKEYGKSVQICDTLFVHYPKYKNISEVYFSAATTYDYLLSDSTNARKYYQVLLDSPKTSKATKKEIKMRLPYLGMSPEEMAGQINLEVEEVLKGK
jgi:outer membrane protein assembly factor BamD (BamD/ComL family)